MNSLDGPLMESLVIPYLNQYTLAQLSIVACAMALLGLGLVFLFFGYIALRISTKPKIRLDTKPASTSTSEYTPTSTRRTSNG